MKLTSAKCFRTVCAVLALLLSLSLFAGCKGDDNVSSSKTTSTVNYSGIENTEIVDEFEDKEHPTLPETKDLGGMEIVIATGKIDMIIPEEGTSAEGDLKLEALREVQEKYNCTISTVFVATWEDAITTILSGEEFANVVQPCRHQSGAFILSRVCADFLDPEISQYIDMDQPWWNDNMAYASNVLGSVYAGASSLCAPAQYTWIIYFNKTIAKDLGIGENEFYDLVDKKEWTWDAMAKYAKMALKDMDGSGAIDSEEDRWGFMAPGNDCAQAFTSTARIASITTDNGMNPRYTFNTEHAISSLTKLNTFFTTDGFYKDTAAVVTNSLFSGGTFKYIANEERRAMENKWGILPMPLGPKEGGGWQDKYLSRVDHNSRSLIIPATVQNKASTALVLEALSFSYFRIINQEVETMALSYLTDDRSIEIARNVYNTTTYEISQFMQGVGTYGSTVESLVFRVHSAPNLDVSNMANSVAVQAQQMIDDYFNGL